MEKKGSIITVSGLSLLIGLVISLQIVNIQNSNQEGLIPISKAKSYEVKLQEVRKEKDLASEQLLQYEQKIYEVENDAAKKDESLKMVVRDIEKYKMISGMSDVIGPGVIITIEDPIFIEDISYEESESVIIEQYDLLISLVNKLKAAGAEAISINGQRILANTAIFPEGDSLLINRIPTAPPYKIKAIGDAAKLESSLTLRYGIVDLIRSFSLQVKIEKQEELTVNKYSGIKKFNYAEPIDDEETMD